VNEVRKENHTVEYRINDINGNTVNEREGVNNRWSEYLKVC
jgi:hypothetical protein